MRPAWLIYLGVGIEGNDDQVWVVLFENKISSNFGVTKIVSVSVLVHVPVPVFILFYSNFAVFLSKKHERECEHEQNVNVNDFVPVHERGRKQERERE